MIWNHRITRVTVGLLLLALAIVVSLPAITGYTSRDGTVNARLAHPELLVVGAIGVEHGRDAHEVGYTEGRV